MPKARSDKWQAASPLELKGFYDAIFSHPDLAVYIVEAEADGSFRFEDANAGVARLANRPLEEIRGRTPHECLITPIADCLETNLRSCVEAKALLQYERSLDLPEGRLSWKTTLVPIAGGDGEPAHVVGVTRDISDETQMQEEVRDLSERLLMLQIEERRLIAQELHDSTAQHLIAADLALERIRERGTDLPDRGFVAAALEDAQQSLREAKRELRVQTFLLHPPLLQGRGLSDAIEAFASGFAARAGLEITSHVDRGADRASDEFAVALLRICQEALTNVHRHARASRVAVTLALGDEDLTLTVLDNGVGIREGVVGSGAKWGVGLSGMRERMERLGGSVSVEPAYPGTRLVASVPLPRDRTQKADAPPDGVAIF